MSVGVFVLLCIEQRWPQESCEREVLSLYSSGGDESGLRQFVKTMYEVFDCRFNWRELES